MRAGLAWATIGRRVEATQSMRAGIDSRPLGNWRDIIMKSKHSDSYTTCPRCHELMLVYYDANGVYGCEACDYQSEEQFD